MLYLIRLWQKHLRKPAISFEAADDFEMALHDLIKKYATEHQRIIFNGNGYSEEWVEEAERRGLPNIRSMVEAIPALVLPSTISMFEEFGVFTEAELRSRAEIKYENYAKAINIEARTMIDMASKQFIPAVIKYTKELADTVVAVKMQVQKLSYRCSFSGSYNAFGKS